jgi:hypothetical protein
VGGVYAAVVFTGMSAMPPFGDVRTFRRIAVCVGASVLFAAIIAPRDAAAHIGRCRSPNLLPGDESQAVAAARRSLPPDVEPFISNRCLLPDKAFAVITTQKVLDDPGVRHWWVANCHRESGDWGCDEAQFEQEFEQRISVDGIERFVAMTIDSGTELLSARSLVMRALRLYADPDWILPYCGGTGGESRWQMVRKLHPLPAHKFIRVTVRSPPFIPSVPPTIGSVLFDEVIQPDDFKFKIQLLGWGPDKQDLPYPCWEAMRHEASVAGVSARVH